ncbi:MAG: hypothetical protein GKR94_34910 [Gammaproteobacteria bacterium]|nr:hypothetical protein [Gammaproteobacteria bacterium]
MSIALNSAAGCGYSIALAVSVLTLLGAAGENFGYERYLQANTVKIHTHSLFRQGALLYELLRNMPEARLRPLMVRSGEMIKRHPTFSETFSLI